MRLQFANKTWAAKSALLTCTALSALAPGVADVAVPASASPTSAVPTSAVPTSVVASSFPASALPALAEPRTAPDVECKLNFNLKSWSVFYKRGKGEGRVECSNGEQAAVSIRVDAGGIAFGKNEIIDGTGQFSKVYGIDEIFGSYAAASADAGAVRSSGATAMTKGPISLAIAGTGRGWDIGLSLGKFRIRRR